MIADSGLPVYEVLRPFTWGEQGYNRGEFIGNGVLPPQTLALLVRAENLRLVPEAKDARTVFEVVHPFPWTANRKLKRGDRILGQELPADKIGSLRRIGWIRPVPDEEVPRRRGRPRKQTIEEQE